MLQSRRHIFGLTNENVIIVGSDIMHSKTAICISDILNATLIYCYLSRDVPLGKLYRIQSKLYVAS